MPLPRPLPSPELQPRRSVCGCTSPVAPTGGPGLRGSWAPPCPPFHAGGLIPGEFARVNCASSASRSEPVRSPSVLGAGCRGRGRDETGPVPVPQEIKSLRGTRKRTHRSVGAGRAVPCRCRLLKLDTSAERKTARKGSSRPRPRPSPVRVVSPRPARSVAAPRPAPLPGGRFSPGRRHPTEIK